MKSQAVNFICPFGSSSLLVTVRFFGKVSGKQSQHYSTSEIGKQSYFCTRFDCISDRNNFSESFQRTL